VEIAPEALATVSLLSVRAAALELGVSANTLQKARRACQQSPLPTLSLSPPNLAETDTDFPGASDEQTVV
jgi:hypothetical protein